MRPIGWGVIGCGGIADKRTIPEGIIPATDSKLVAVMGPHKEKVEAVADKYGVSGRYTDVESLLSDPQVDAVYIGSPNYVHHRQVIAAAEAGKHILCEKPLAMTVKECEEMVSVCKREDVRFSAGFMMRFHSCHKEALRIVDGGLIGDLVTGRIQFACWYPDIPGAWRQDPVQGGGGCLMDLGIHGINLLRMFLGDVVEVFAYNDTLTFGYPVEDSSTVTMKFETGIYGMVDSYFNIRYPAAGNGLELNGTKGSIITEGTIGQESKGSLSVSVENGEKGQVITPVPVNIYKAEAEDLIRSIREGTEPLNSGEEGLKDQKIAMAAYESSRTGQKVRIH